MEESKHEMAAPERYITTGILSACKLPPTGVTTSRLTDELLSQMEGLLVLPASLQSRAGLILDPSTLYQRLVRPESDLLHFTSKDLDAIDAAFRAARKRLQHTSWEEVSQEEEEGRSEEGLRPSCVEDQDDAVVAASRPLRTSEMSLAPLDDQEMTARLRSLGRETARLLTSFNTSP